MLLVYCSIRKALCLALRVHSRGIFVHLFSGHFGFSLGVKAISDSFHIAPQYWIVLYVYAFPSTRSAVSGRYTGALEEAIIGWVESPTDQSSLDFVRSRGGAAAVDCQ